MSQSSDQQLKQYEREILRARSRVQVADLDTEIDKLIERILGKLAKSEHMQYQAARLRSFLTNPETIVERRAFLLGLTPQQIKKLTAPDFLTMEEMASLVVIMQNIADWLEEQLDEGKNIVLQDLVRQAELIGREAYAQFYLTYQRYPSITDVPETLMRVSRARTLKRIADNAGILLPSESDEGKR